MEIKPRTASDRGGYACLPLVKNVPNPKDKNWRAMICQDCGRACWLTPEAWYVHVVQGVRLQCTECALKKGGG